MNIIELKNIHKTYKSNNGTVSILRDLNLEVQKGEFLAIIGGSGQGKSTLLNILGCLDRPDKGEYLLDQEPVNWDSSSLLSALRGHRISVIFQSFELIQGWTVAENVEMPLRFRGVPRHQRGLLALKALRRVNLLAHSNKYPHELSGGEQQRCAIARAICADADVLLADEPTGNLDPDTANVIMEHLLELNRQCKTIIFLTHDHALSKRANRIAELKAGTIEWWSEQHAER